MKKLRNMSDTTQSLVVTLSMGVVAFTVAFAIKLLYNLL
jgi:hypothetical protein